MVNGTVVFEPERLGLPAQGEALGFEHAANTTLKGSSKGKAQPRTALSGPTRYVNLPSQAFGLG